MVTSFDKYKQDVLGKKDKSSIGDTDEKIKSLCDKINSMKDYYTTSSCSGRITLVKDNTKKLPGLFLWRTHEKTSFGELKLQLENSKFAKDDSGIVYFKQEPCLLVVSCRNSESQKKLFDIARNNGWKKSGIISTDKRLIIELISAENISLPIINNGEVLVDDNYLKFLVKEANKKLELTWKKIEKLNSLMLTTLD
ncbi:MAG: hypothetical protein PHF67_00190 [Candidatus Nanoarchaeia archaeon]|nr:hypothetical protein [Candidatus Nanoarchaeia archaeon]